MASRRLFWVFASLAMFSVIGSAASKWFGIDPGPIAPVASLALILSGALAIGFEMDRWGRVAFVLLFSAGIELVGLFTGFPFGRYVYTDRWWPAVELGGGHYFPLLLPLAWLLIVGGATLFSARVAPPSARPWLAALVATAVDAPMERAMCDVFGYWKWLDGGPVFGAPVLNSVGWFVTALIGSSILGRQWAEPPSNRGGRTLAMFCAFVALVGALHGYDPAWLLLGAFAVGISLFDRTSTHS